MIRRLLPVLLLVLSGEKEDRMAISKCGHCNGTSFELKEHTPAGSQYSIYFVQCATCGSVVGTMDNRSVPVLMDLQNEAIKKIASALNVSVKL